MQNRTSNDTVQKLIRNETDFKLIVESLLNFRQIALVGNFFPIKLRCSVDFFSSPYEKPLSEVLKNEQSTDLPVYL